ncbi:MAG: hypothetical protein NC417_13980, partial [Candidatus Gastranaerophilales bacterium]|nr:hypothetical protein [Candidatus Gastranaerophilales bacterium]
DENVKVSMTEKQKVKEITDRLEAGLKELFEILKNNVDKSPVGGYNESVCGKTRCMINVHRSQYVSKFIRCIDIFGQSVSGRGSIGA